jgi:hypothetical protein
MYISIFIVHSRVLPVSYRSHMYAPRASSLDPQAFILIVGRQQFNNCIFLPLFEPSWTQGEPGVLAIF